MLGYNYLETLPSVFEVNIIWGVVGVRTDFSGLCVAVEYSFKGKNDILLLVPIPIKLLIR